MNNSNRNNSIIDKSDAFNILDRIIGFIRNCDNKSFIILGIFGGIATIILTSDLKDSLIKIYKSAYAKDTFCSDFYLLLLIAPAFLALYGIYKILKVLDVQLSDEKYKIEEELELDSKIYFYKISNNAEYIKYKNKILEVSEEGLLNDILSQIYINSKICKNKYDNYKIGFKCSILSFLAFVILWIIGAFIYLYLPWQQMYIH